MGLLARVLRPDATRKTRLHTSNGRLCLQPFDLALALGTTVLRHASGRLVDLPWIAFPASRFLEGRIAGAVVFEYSVGSSTVWYGRRALRLYAVEDDRVWFETVSRRTRGMSNVRLRLAEDEDRYVRSIDEVPEDGFDVISIDGSFRRKCLERAVDRLRPGGILVVDNTDTTEGGELARWLGGRFPATSLRRYAGFAPGILHPIETTVCVSPVDNA